VHLLITANFSQCCRKVRVRYFCAEIQERFVCLVGALSAEQTSLFLIGHLGLGALFDL
jgi:hypothetical protein